MKKTVWIIWGIVSFYMVFPMKAQETHNIKLGFFAGIDGVDGPLIKPSQIREYSNYFYDDFLYFEILSGGESVTIKRAGVDAEYFVYRNRLGISGGLQVSQYSSSFKSPRNFFFWELGNDGLTTDYLRIQNIKQNSYYLGIPLGFRFFIQNREKPFQVYTKIGFNFDFRVGTDNEITFHNKAMDKYAKTVENQLEKPSPFSAYFYPAIGFKFGKFKVGTKRPWFNLEFRIPGAMMNSSTATFVKPEVGLGVQISMQIPLGDNVPIGSK
jgi:hypothetical protein